MASDSSSRARRYLRYSSLGLEFALGAVLGFVIGKEIDEALGLRPVLFTVSLALLGASAGMFRLFREFVRPPRDGKPDHEEPDHEEMDSGPKTPKNSP